MNQYRRGYLLIGQKGALKENGADQSALLPRRIAFSQKKRAIDVTNAISTAAGQSKFDRATGMLIMAPAIRAIAAILPKDHMVEPYQNTSKMDGHTSTDNCRFTECKYGALRPI